MKQNWLWLTIIIIVGAALRLYNLTAISLWHDEAFSALLINYSWKEMFYRIGLDVHPPAYYIALRLWTDLFGHGLEALRGFSAFFGIATIYAVYLFVNAAFKNSRLALIASALIALQPFQIQYVTEARMYTFGAFVLIISAYFLARALETQQEYFKIKEQGFSAAGRATARKLWCLWLLFAVSTSTLIYTHYYLFFSVAAIGMFGLFFLFKEYGFRLAGFKYWLTGYTLILLSFLPWLKIFLFQFSQVQENYWIPKITIWSVPLTNWRMLFGNGADPGQAATKIILVLGLFFTGIMVLRVFKKTADSYKNLVLLGLLVPFAGALLLSLKQSIFLDRYFLFAALFYTINLGIFIDSFTNKYVRYGLFILASLIMLNNYFQDWRALDLKNRPGISAAANFLNNNVTAKDRLIVNTSFEFFNFKYYNRTPRTPLFYAEGINKVSELPHFSGTALLTDADLIHDLNAGSTKKQIVWILWTNAFGGSKSAVPQNWQQIGEYSWADVRPYKGTNIYVSEYVVN